MQYVAEEEVSSQGARIPVHTDPHGGSVGFEFARRRRRRRIYSYSMILWRDPGREEMDQ